MSERDNAKFTIERSSKNSNWTAIDEVMALSNNISNQFINKYSFVDKQPLKGKISINYSNLI